MKNERSSQNSKKNLDTSLSSVQEFPKVPGFWESSIYFTEDHRTLIFPKAEYFQNFENFPTTWELGTFQMSGNLGNSIRKFPKKRNLGSAQIFFGNLRVVYLKFLEISLYMGISQMNLETFPTKWIKEL